MSLSSSSSRSPADVFAPVVSSLSKRFASSQYHRSEEHTSELQSRLHLVCRLLLEKKKQEPCTTHHRRRIQHSNSTDPRVASSSTHISSASTLCDTHTCVTVPSMCHSVYDTTPTT